MQTGRGADRIKAVVIGASAGGLHALLRLFARLPPDCAVPLVVALHRYPDAEEEGLEVFFRGRCPLPVHDAADKDDIAAGQIYFAPPDYHLLIESAASFALSVDAKVNFARPSVDVLFESAARVWGAGLLGVVLTGANGDGAEGLRRIKELGGMTVVQDPATAEYPVMPRAALATGAVDLVLCIEEIGELIGRLGSGAARDL